MSENENESLAPEPSGPQGQRIDTGAAEAGSSAAGNPAEREPGLGGALPPGDVERAAERRVASDRRAERDDDRDRDSSARTRASEDAGDADDREEGRERRDGRDRDGGRIRGEDLTTGFPSAPVPQRKASGQHGQAEGPQVEPGGE
ncbi:MULTISPECIES: hypothetical protein [Actinomadura]|uniref:Uncharacterized protein n=1 Tax=Actinomadura yumaensis TaxID=111807 RepID=A0ABW2CTV6_9ACTN|nr:hypothetical protein [Actinomadura sp. J1-007]